MTEDIENTNGTENGIVKLNGYTFWSKVEVVEIFVVNDLKKKFPNSLIIPELNKMDFAVIKENLPVEIQSTMVHDKYLTHSGFEDRIRKQIEDNIENYERCWFYFDSEYYRYLNESAKSNASINLDWFAKYVKEGKLKVFTVKYDGEIKELKYEDLEFIRLLSNTCKIECGSDERILNRNKLKIMDEVLTKYNFTQCEIDKFINLYDLRKNKIESLSTYLMKEDDERKSHYGNILYSMGHLKTINNILNMNDDYGKVGKRSGGYLGIFKLYGHGGYDNKTEFINESNICQYFPGYIRNNEKWESLKGTLFSDRQLKDIFWVKNTRSSLLDY